MNIVERAKNILITPKTEWEAIDKEEGNLMSVLTTYVVPLTALGAIATLIGWGVIGRWGGTSWELGFRIMAIYIVRTIAGYLITTFVVDALAPSFGSEKNINKSAQFVGYSYTASLVGAIFFIIPALTWLAGLAGLYGLYLMYLGLGPMKKTPEDKKVGYLVVSILVLLVAYAVVGMIMASILIGSGVGYSYLYY